VFDALDLARPHLAGLQPYTSARDEYTGDAHVYLDANENPYGSVAGGTLNRYPDPHQRDLKDGLAKILDVGAEQIFVGNGSDEAIDLLVHAFCEPGVDHILITPPTYGMYAVTAAVNNVGVKEVALGVDYAMQTDAVITALTADTKLVFLCSPNNPTGNLQDPEAMLAVAASAPGLVVVDEAYIDFAPSGSVLRRLKDFPNLVVLRTFSKAWGMAGARIGVAAGHPSVVTLFDRIKLPYNVSQLAQDVAMDALPLIEEKERFVARIMDERASLASRLRTAPGVEHVYPSDANFLLVRFTDAAVTYHRLVELGIIVRDRSRVELCEGGLRITVGSREENDALLHGLAAAVP